MIQVIEQSEEEKIAMYMKMSKEQIIAILIQANNMLDYMYKSKPYYISMVEKDILPPFHPTCSNTDYDGHEDVAITYKK